MLLGGYRVKLNWLPFEAYTV